MPKGGLLSAKLRAIEDDRSRTDCVREDVVLPARDRRLGASPDSRMAGLGASPAFSEPGNVGNGSDVSFAAIVPNGQDGRMDCGVMLVRKG